MARAQVRVFIFICAIVFLILVVLWIGEVADVGIAFEFLIDGGVLWDGWLGDG